MKKIITLLLLTLSFGVIATPGNGNSGNTPAVSNITVTPVTGISSVMTGTIGVGTNVVAGINQYQTQTTTGSLTGSASISNVTITPTLTSSIVGTVNSVSTGTGFTLPSYLVTDNSTTLGVSAIASGTVTSTLTNVVIPTTTITTSN